MPHYSIIQSSFTSHKSSVLCLFTHLATPNCPWSFWTVSIVLLFQGIVKLGSYCVWPFEFGVFHLVICIEASSRSFYGLIAHFFLTPNSISFLNVPQFFSILLHVGCFQVLAVMNNADKKHLCAGFSVDLNVSVHWGEYHRKWLLGCFVRMCLVL